MLKLLSLATGWLTLGAAAICLILWRLPMTPLRLSLAAVVIAGLPAALGLWHATRWAPVALGALGLCLAAAALSLPVSLGVIGDQPVPSSLRLAALLGAALAVLATVGLAWLVSRRVARAV